MNPSSKFAFVLSPNLPSKLKAGTLIALIVLIITCVVGYTSFQKTVSESEKVKHSFEVKVKVEEVASAVKDANRGISGILLRNDYSFYSMYREAKKNCYAHFTELAKLTIDNKNQQQNLQELHNILDKRFTVLDSVIVLFAAQNKPKYTLGLDTGRVLMDSTERLFAKIRTTENILLVTRSNNSKDSVEQSKAVIAIFAIVSLLIIIICFYLLFRSLTIIQEREKIYRAIFENSNDLKCLCYPNLTIIDTNPQFDKILVTKQTDKQLKLDVFFDDTEELALVKNMLVANKNVKRKQLTFVADNGKRFTCITNFVLVDNKMKIYSVILTDISEQIRLQDEKEAMENFANIGRVSRMLAHEVRNPLTNINLAIEGLYDENKDENLITYFDIIGRNSSRISKLITELLNSTKPNILEYSNINVSEFVNEILLLAKDRINFSNVKITTHIAADIPMLKGDKEKLSIALLNIIINALEAMPKENGELFIEAFVLSNKLIHINIGDNGIGMDEETTTNIFKPFFTKKQSGSGLGLATTQNIILTHKGKIGVNSTLGKGTVFTVQLPLV